MSISVNKIYPKVFKSNASQKIFIRLSEQVEETLLGIKVQPMEKYSVPHTPAYRIDEEERYSYQSLTACGDGVYCTEYAFTSEQQYTVKVKYDGKVICAGHVYSLAPDLAELKAFKGDTHLHTCRSDGKGTPFEVATDYRASGYDFIAVTDHHRFAPSLEAQSEMKKYTDKFHVFRGEEVHNKDMGYFHIVNFNGESSVNDIIETDDAYVSRELERIVTERDLSSLSDPKSVAYRIFVAEHIRKAGGVAIMAHPYWETFGEYHMQTEEFIYHWQNGDFDALEVIAGCDGTGNGNNLQEMLRTDMLSEGYKIPAVGSSDAHTTVNVHPSDRFNVQFTLVFAKSFDEIPNAIKDCRGVAIERRSDRDFRAVGRFRYAKYARFLMWEYYPEYTVLCRAHADAIAKGDEALISVAEKNIKAFNGRFFNV